MFGKWLELLGANGERLEQTTFFSQMMPRYCGFKEEVM